MKPGDRVAYTHHGAERGESTMAGTPPPIGSLGTVVSTFVRRGETCLTVCWDHAVARGDVEPRPVVRGDVAIVGGMS